MEAQHRKPKKDEAEKPIAKKCFVICQNAFYLEIKTGDDLSSVPTVYLPNLKKEGVL